MIIASTIMVTFCTDIGRTVVYSRSRDRGYGGIDWPLASSTSLLYYPILAVFKPADDGIEPWLNLGNAGKLLKIAPKTLRLAAEAGEIEAFHPLSEGPWIFARASLLTTAAQSIAERARQNPRYPAGSHPNQQSLFSSTTY